MARYLAYLAFALAVPIFWYFAFAYVSVVIDKLPQKIASFCDCSEQSWQSKAFAFSVAFGAFLATISAFIQYRKLVRRLLGVPNRRWPNQ